MAYHSTATPFNALAASTDSSCELADSTRTLHTTETSTDDGWQVIDRSRRSRGVRRRRAARFSSSAKHTFTASAANVHSTEPYEARPRLTKAQRTTLLFKQLCKQSDAKV